MIKLTLRWNRVNIKLSNIKYIETRSIKVSKKHY